MKHILSFLFVAMIAGEALAQTTFEVNGLKYTVIDEENHYVSVGQGAKRLAGELTIPSVIENDGAEYIVTSIPTNAFGGCTGITSIVVPNSVVSIGEGAFTGCGGLTSITLPFVGDRPHSSTDLNQYPFGYIFGSASYDGGTETTQFYYKNKTDMSNDPYYIPTTRSTYYIPTSLKVVVITGSKHISYGAFEHCVNLTSITIPSSVISIGNSVFANCMQLREIIVQSGNEYFISENGILFNKDKTAILCYPAGKTDKVYTIPSTVTRVGYLAFSFCNNLTITIPNSVKNVEKWAFYSGSQSGVLCEEKSRPSNWQVIDIPSRWGCTVISVEAYNGIATVEGTNYAVKGSDGSLWFLPTATNRTVTITATANSVHPFIKWNDDDVENPRTIDVTENKKYIAIFEAHTEVADAAVAPTCTETGKTAGEHCSVCNAVLAGLEDIPALGHIEVEDDRVESTCTADGHEAGKYCSVCKAVLEGMEVIPALGHNYSTIVNAPTCTAVGFTTHTCSVCEYTCNSDTVAANGHTEVVDAAIAATCTIAGKTEGKHCSVCNETLVAQQEVAATGHNEVVDAAVAATCTTAGKTEGKHCSVCNAVLVAQEDVVAIGHKFEKYTYNNDATTTADGTETAVCERGCGETDTRTAAGTKLAETPEKSTAVAEYAANAINIYAYDNTIVVENATEEIFVYDAMGKLICRDAARVSAEFRVASAGVYIVKTGSVVKRIVINF